MPYDYDEVQMAKEKQIKWICLFVAVIMAGVAVFIIHKSRPEKVDMQKNEAFKKGLYQRAREEPK